MNALILCNGEPPSWELLATERSRADIFIACDGAANIALKFGQVPDIIIGDLDSIGSNLTNLHNIKHIADQHNNDLEKALDHANFLGVKNACILGASGFRFDHFLANLYILPKFISSMSLRMADSYGEAWIANREEEIKRPLFTPISLFALGNKAVRGLTLKGLKYILKDAVLEPHSSMASLNYFSDEQANITHSDGILLLYTAKNY